MRSFLISDILNKVSLELILQQNLPQPILFSTVIHEAAFQSALKRPYLSKLLDNIL